MLGKGCDKGREMTPLYDVIQVGYGPVSKALAIFLARRRGHRAAY
jgi:lysine/ornithine N-monooxygenase